MRSRLWQSVSVLGLASVLAVLLAQPPGYTAAKGEKDPVFALFEDDTPTMIRSLTEFTGNEATARRELVDVYSGFHSLRVTPMQRFNPRIAGWNYPIVEEPGPGQYRYLRFAWKKIGGKGIMIQLCALGTNWEHRYVAGANVVNYNSIIVANKPPADWTVVTRDLFKDFGVMNLSGIAFTPMDGTAGLYDHFYLGRTVEDLNKIDRKRLGVETPKEDLPANKLKALWEELADSDDAKALLAQRTLLAVARQSVPLFKEQLRPVDKRNLDKEIAQLIAQLDDDNFKKREAATEKLEQLGPQVVPAVNRALNDTPSLEAQRRLERILAKVTSTEPPVPPEQVRAFRAIRILELVGTKEAREVLDNLAKGSAESDVTRAAKAAAERLKKASK
jgi:hypothetical protein